MMNFKPITKEKTNNISDSIESNFNYKTVDDLIVTKPIRNAARRLCDAKNEPEVKQLFSVIWHSNELLLLFADTGIGKSILAVSLADSISKGIGLMGFKNEHNPLIVLYYDFELSDRQFRKRYSDESGDRKSTRLNSSH